MPRTLPLDVLLTMVDEPAGQAVPAPVVAARLAAAGRGTRADRLLVALLELERSGHVALRRDADYAGALTDVGRAAALELAGGRAVDATVVLADLVGFVAFTEAHGDRAASDVGAALRSTTDEVLRAHGGRLVKTLGDGVLGALPPAVDAVEVLRELAGAVRRPDGDRWPLRAGVRCGQPIERRGDLFGRDVNLAARLCEAARPDEAVLSFAGVDPDGDLLAVRGLDRPVPVIRVALR